MVGFLKFSLVVFVFIGCFSNLSAETWYIKPDGTGDAPTIQAGVDSAVVGDTVLLADGAFTGDGNRDVDFRGKAITVCSESGDQESCIIDCEGDQDNSHGGFYFVSGEGNNSVLACVTITNGYRGFNVNTNEYDSLGSGIQCHNASPTIINCIVSESIVEYSAYSRRGCGSGIQCFSSSPIIIGCVISDNVLHFDGGGMYCESSSPKLTNCSFQRNMSHGYEHGHGGGGVCCINSNSTFTNCSFDNNGAFWGCGSYFSDGSASFNQCTFSNNRGGVDGGAISCYSCSLEVNDCIFSSNECQNGGAMTVFDWATVSITHCTFIDNYSFSGGGISCGSASITITSCTFSNNTSVSEVLGTVRISLDADVVLENTIIAFSDSGQAVCCDDSLSVPVLTCCNIYGNEGGDWVGCIADQAGINGNISADPQFCGEDNPAEPYTLGERSPCAAENNPVCGLIGAKPVGCISPVCDVTPLILDFGMLLPGHSLEKSFTITNVGGGMLRGSVSESCGCYCIVSGEGSYCLAGGESHVVTVRFSPEYAGEFTCMVETGSPCEDVACTGASLGSNWIDNGIPICTAAEGQIGPQIVQDDAGGAIITWQDNRSGNYDIYAQRIDATGNVQWAANGVAVCATTDLQSDPRITPDGAGGAIITWEDSRNGNYDIYAQRIDATGNVRWTTNGIAVCVEPSSKSDPQIVSDNAGGAVIVWRDNQGEDLISLYAQAISANSSVKWAENGIKVWGTLGPTTAIVSPRIVSDCAGGAIVVWAIYDHGSYGRIYMRHVTSSGDVQWNWYTGGCTPDDNPLPQITSDGAGGAIISWSGLDYYYYEACIYAGSFDSDGHPVWLENEWPISSFTADQCQCRIASDGAGGVIIAGCYNNFSNPAIISVQRISNSGVALWAQFGVFINCTINNPGDFSVVSDCANGAIVSWRDERNGNYDIYAQHIDGYGNIQWEESSVAICTAAGYQGGLQIASDDAGGAIITWQDARNGNSDIYAMRVCEYVAPIATLVQSFNTSAGGSCITVEWTLSDLEKQARFFILRAEADKKSFEELVDPKISREDLTFTFTDNACEQGKAYLYRVEVQDGEGRRVLFETDAVSLSAMPLALYQNHPNPFNPSTTIRYYLPERCRVTLEIFDVAGRHIKQLVDECQNSGDYIVGWNGTDAKGASVSSGIYFYSLRAGKEAISRKLVILK